MTSSSVKRGSIAAFEGFALTHLIRASSTSAAPWFFKPKVINNLGTFQDGGLRYNNPLNVALLEHGFLWPGKGEPDFALSLGTGTSEAKGDAFASGPQSPVRDRFLPRLYKTFMLNLDGEKAWHELVNNLPPERTMRYHRLNLTLKGPEPAIDDVAAMSLLKGYAEEKIAMDAQITSLLDSMHASMFFFELDDVPSFIDDAHQCSGHIFCRIELPPPGKAALLLRLTESSTYFLVNGVPLASVGPETKKKALSFRRRVRFQVPCLDDSVGISIRGLTTRPRSISGMPKTLKQLIQLQRLKAPFGRATHDSIEKSLPRIPMKRKAAWSEYYARKQVKV
ncbi:MAG: hypothetical protein Q9157_002777 [Trypethelium eluteriae]